MAQLYYGHIPHELGPSTLNDVTAKNKLCTKFCYEILHFAKNRTRSVFSLSSSSS